MRDHARHLRLLEHHLGDEDRVRVARAPPGQIVAAVCREPPEQRFLHPATVLPVRDAAARPPVPLRESALVTRVRFAPSPTGSLHLGGALTAVANRRFADERGGVLVLRIDDTDAARVERDAEAGILRDLEWLGVGWDEGPVRQSERGELYRAAASGCSSPEPRSRTRARCASAKSAGRRSFAPDGPATYHLASVVDDIDLRITHVIRGQGPPAEHAAPPGDRARARRRAARVRPPRPDPRAGRGEALEAPRRRVGRRSARGGHSRRGGTRLPR